MSWSSASLIVGPVWSRTLLTRPSTSEESDWECACVQIDNISNIHRGLVMELINVLDKKSAINFVCSEKVVPLLVSLRLSRRRWGTCIERSNLEVCKSSAAFTVSITRYLLIRGAESPKSTTARSAKNENRPLPPVPPSDELVSHSSLATGVHCYYWFLTVAGKNLGF